MADTLPRLVSPRAAETLEAVRNVTGGFDIDAYHVMDERDNALIADEILHGVGSDTFVYNFEIKGTPVTGISVVGARHLANHYRGLKHRIVGSVQKSGALFEYRAFPSDMFAGDTRATVINDLAAEPDYYSVVVEIADIKTGNTIMVESREERLGYSRSGQSFDRPNYQKIAQSKAYRNAVLALIPQDVAIRWKGEMLKLKKGETITGSVLEEKRASVLRFATRASIALDRRRLDQLTLDQIAGLGDAAREGQLPAFANAASALGLTMASHTPGAETSPQQPLEQAPRRRGRPPGSRNATTNEPGEQEPPADETSPGERTVEFEA